VCAGAGAGASAAAAAARGLNAFRVRGPTAHTVSFKKVENNLFPVTSYHDRYQDLTPEDTDVSCMA
jgi:hypothetical protein